MPEIPEALVRGVIPLSRAALCLDCEVIYVLGEPACSLCGSTRFAPFATFLNRSAA